MHESFTSIASTTIVVCAGHFFELEKYCQSLVSAARDNRNAVSLHVSATPQNNFVVDTRERVIDVPRPPTYTGFVELCRVDKRRLADERAELSAELLCEDYARALVQYCSPFVRSLERCWLVDAEEGL